MSRVIDTNPQNFRGTNYVASIAYGTDKLLGTLPFPGGPIFQVFQPGGFFDARHSDDELRALASHGINNIRLWGSFWAWVVDAPGYLAALSTVAENCWRHGISVTFILWNTTSTYEQGALHRLIWGNPNWRPSLRRPNWNQLARPLWAYTGGRALEQADLVPGGEPWLVNEYDEPANALFWKPFGSWDQQLEIYIDEYLKDIARFFSRGHGAAVIASYDLFNEADAAANSNESHVDPRDNMVNFIAFTYFRLHLYHTGFGSRLPACTVGWAFMSDFSKAKTVRLQAMGVAHGYLSSHSYEFRTDEFRRHIRDARDFAAARGLPYVCSEFWERRVPMGSRYPRSIAPYLDVIAEELVGGQVWGFLAYNVFDKINGVPQPVDGFITPRRGVFTPLFRTATGEPFQPPFGGLLDPHPWPGRVLVDVTPPASGDLAAVKRWTKSRGVVGFGT